MGSRRNVKKIRGLKSGTLIILSPANAAGSRDGVRNVEGYRDFLGNSLIFSDMEEDRDVPRGVGGRKNSKPSGYST